MSDLKQKLVHRGFFPQSTAECASALRKWLSGQSMAESSPGCCSSCRTSHRTAEGKERPRGQARGTSGLFESPACSPRKATWMTLYNSDIW